MKIDGYHTKTFNNTDKTNISFNHISIQRTAFTTKYFPTIKNGWLNYVKFYCAEPVRQFAAVDTQGKAKNIPQRLNDMTLTVHILLTHQNRYCETYAAKTHPNNSGLTLSLTK